MNEQEALKQLRELLLGYPINVHPKVISEILACIQKSGSEENIFSIFAQRLIFLSNQGYHAVKHKEFELLKDGIYSMHISTTSINLRVLYAFRNSAIVLLCAFFERGGKKRTDYTSRIPEAKARLAELD